MPDKSYKSCIRSNKIKAIKILIVDDEVEVLSFLNNFLTRKGIKVFTAIDGKDALAVFNREMPDIVLLDVTMPCEDGFFVLKKIKEILPRTRVVMITARDDDASIAKANKLGVKDYIVKPMELETLDVVMAF